MKVKGLFFIQCAIYCLISISCYSQESIVGSWSKEAISTDIRVNDVPFLDYAQKLGLPEDQARKMVRYLENEIIPQDVVFVFQSDGTYQIKSDGDHETGTWSRDTVSKKLEMLKDGDSKVEVLKVVKLTSSDLVLIFEVKQAQDLNGDGESESFYYKATISFQKRQ